VLAADVLYEKRDVEPLLALLDELLHPGPEAWIADPGRAAAAGFLTAAADRFMLRTLPARELPHGGIHRLRTREKRA
jgi:hypothetical protein